MSLEPAACLRGPGGRVETPSARHALQSMLTAIVERESGTRDQILDCARHEHLTGCCECRDPSTCYHGDPCNLLADEFALARVDSTAHFQVVRFRAIDDRTCTCH